MIEKIDAFHVVGIVCRSTNANQQAMKDIPALWNRFMGENIGAMITNKVDETIYCLYANYESDQNGAYDVVLGYAVSDLNQIPEGMQGFSIPQGQYQKFEAKGDLTSNAVADAWYSIWMQSLNRAYTIDFERYDERAANPKDGIADIFIALK